MDKQTDYNSLLRKFQGGDGAAREEMFRCLQVRLRSVLEFRMRGWAAEEVEDILQDTLTVLAQKLAELESNPQVFALEVLRNKIGNHIGTHRRRIQVSIDPTDAEDTDLGRATADVRAIPREDDQFAMVEDRDTADAIRKALRQLSALCQALFTALLEQQSVSDTWEFFQSIQGDLTRSTFDKRLFDCRRKLRQLMAHTL